MFHKHTNAGGPGRLMANILAIFDFCIMRCCVLLFRANPRIHRMINRSFRDTDHLSATCYVQILSQSCRYDCLLVLRNKSDVSSTVTDWRRKFFFLTAFVWRFILCKFKKKVSDIAPLKPLTEDNLWRTHGVTKNMTFVTNMYWDCHKGCASNCDWT